MQEHDDQYNEVCKERDALLAHNQALIEELNALKNES